jgi:Flp pilus assembly protein TadG
MRHSKTFRKGERGSTLVEYSIAVTVFITAMFGVIEFGRALWVHNALTDATRRGARYAVLHSVNDIAQVKNVVVYGDPAGGAKPIVPNLSTANVDVSYSQMAVNAGTATVKVSNYQFQFVVPIVGKTITMPSYTSTLTGESAGFVPNDF